MYHTLNCQKTFSNVANKGLWIRAGFFNKCIYSDMPFSGLSFQEIRVSLIVLQEKGGNSKKHEYAKFFQEQARDVCEETTCLAKLLDISSTAMKW